MESTHGPGHGQGHGSVSWDPSGFGPGEPWGQQYGTAFDQDVSASGDYPSPEFTNNSALNSHMAGAVNHGDGLQNAYGFYRQGDVWPGHPQATTASFSQSSPPPHEYQRDRQQQFSGGNQTVAGRFTVDLHQGNGFPNQFARDMSQTPDGYHHQRLAQWQEPANYGLNQMFDNPLHANTVSGDAAGTFYPNHGPVELVTSRFEADGHEQIPAGSRPIHPQFAHQTGQQPAIESFRFPATQPAAEQQQIFDHQPHPSSGHPQPRLVEDSNTIGPKQNLASQPQATPATAELIKVPTPAPAPPALPSLTPAPAPANIQHAAATQAQPPSPAEPICSINFVNNELLASPIQPGTRWPGVPNLVIGTAPVKLQNGPPTKRYVTLATKGGVGPLFPEAPRGWMPAEMLGNHFKAYETYMDPSDIADRQSADIRLELEMKRANMETPLDWDKKGLKDRLNRQPNRPDKPKEPELTALEAAELLRIHPAHLNNPAMVGEVVSGFSSFIQTKASSLHGLLGSTNPPATATQVQLAKTQLQLAIEQGLRAEPSHLIERMSGSQKMIAGLMNTMVRLLNTGERPSSLVHAILRFYMRLTGVTPAQWERFRLVNVKKALEKQDDKVGLRLISQVGGIGDESPEASGSEGSNPSAKPGAGGKKAARTSAQTVPPSKQTTVGSDRKKTAASSSTKSTTSTSDLRKSSAALTSSKKMASAGETNKPVSKTTEKLPSKAIGIKRSRDEEQGVVDARSAKKANNPASVTKSLATSTSKTAPTASTTATKPVTTASSTPGSATQPKPRTGLLLPGKARPTIKSAPKSQSIKLEPASKSSTAKPSTATSVTQAATPKPGDAAKSSESTNSTFSTLMKEIQQEKTIRAPESHRKKASAVDPNETPEERERRLRKESRRHLRVAFKTGDALVEIREFTREPEEIAEANMARSARIDGRDKNAEEAQTMKRHHNGGNITATEINDREWEEPTLVDFTTIDESLRTHTFDTRGGFKTFESEERRRMKERESTELVAVYSRRADIPPTPRSPPYEPSLPAERLERKEWNLSSMAAIHDEAKLRAWEYKNKGPKFAAEAVLKRLKDQQRVHDEWRAANPDSVRTRDGFKAPVVRVQWPPSDTLAEDPRTWFHPSAAAERDRQTLMALSTAKTRFFRDCDKYDETLPPRKTEEELDTDPKLQDVLNKLSIITESLKADKAREEAEEKMIAGAKVAGASNPQQQEVPQPYHQPTVAASQTTQQQSAAPDYTAAWAQYYADQQQQQQQQQQGWYAQQAANAHIPPQIPQATSHQPATDSNNQVASILAALGTQQQAAQPLAQNQASGYPLTDQSQLNTVLMALGLQSQNQPQASAPTAQTQAYQQYYGQAAAQNYGQGYGQSHQEREAYGNLYGNGNNDSSQDRDRERTRERDSSGWDRNDRDRGERSDRDRDHHYRGGNTSSSGRGRNGGNSANSGGGRGNDNVPEHLRGINRNLIGTKACAFWAKGQCAKGDKCTFRHD